MSGERASVFNSDEDFDVSGFAPKPVESRQQSLSR